VTRQGEPVLVTSGTGCRCSRIIDLLRKEESAETVAVHNMCAAGRRTWPRAPVDQPFGALDALTRKRINL
jgi:hypothetical protein